MKVKVHWIIDGVMDIDADTMKPPKRLLTKNCAAL